jgi:hypothetical protein
VTRPMTVRSDKIDFLFQILFRLLPTDPLTLLSIVGIQLFVTPTQLAEIDFHFRVKHTPFEINYYFQCDIF